jgi:hypothetical protein
MDKDCTNVVSLESILSGIKNGRWKKEVDQLRSIDKTSKEGREKLDKLKRTILPAFIPTGIFEERVDDGCVLYNNLMVIDIDNVPESKINSIKRDLMRRSWVKAFFNSPTKAEKGLKIIIMVDISYDDHLAAFLGIEEMFFKLYGIEIDPSGKNTSRLCYISYDPDLFYNKAFTPFSPPLIDPRVKYGNFYGRKAKIGEGVTDSRLIFKHCSEWVKKSKTGSYHKGNRNNYIFAVSCLMCEYGVPEENTFGELSSRYQSLELKELNTTIRSAYKRAGKNYGTRVLYKKGDNRNQVRLANMIDLFNHKTDEE